MASREIERAGKSYIVEKNGSYSVSRAGKTVRFSLPRNNMYRIGGFTIGATGHETFESILASAIRDLEAALEKDVREGETRERHQERGRAIEQQADEFFAEAPDP